MRRLAIVLLVQCLLSKTIRTQAFRCIVISLVREQGQPHDPCSLHYLTSRDENEEAPLVE